MPKVKSKSPPKILKATYQNEDGKLIVSKFLVRFFKYRRWWWEGNTLYISFYKETDYQDIKVRLLIISHDTRISFPAIRRELHKQPLNDKDIRHLKRENFN